MRFELTCPKGKRFSRPPRYDRFDNPPYMNCRSADFIGYSIFLEIFLEILFSVAFGVPEKSVFTRLFFVFATDMLANFQDSLVMTASIYLRKYDARGCIIFTEAKRLCSMMQTAYIFVSSFLNDDLIILSHGLCFVKGYFDVFSFCVPF